MKYKLSLTLEEFYKFKNIGDMHEGKKIYLIKGTPNASTEKMDVEVFTR